MGFYLKIIHLNASNDESVETGDESVEARDQSVEAGENTAIVF